MPYYTDTVASFTLLKSTIESYCVANGWTLADGILSKDSCFFKLIDSTTSQLQLWGGLSKTGSTLNGTPTYGVRLYNSSSDTIVFPIRYHLFIFNNPIEVYCFIEYNSISYQHISFGKSNLNGIGLGAWFTGSYLSTSGSSNLFRFNLNVDSASIMSTTSSPGGNLLTGMFCSSIISAAYYHPSYIYSDLDTTGWKNIGNAGSKVAGLLTSLPNLSNQANVLLPIKAVLNRSSGGLTILANLINSRLLRIDNHESKEIITFGSNQWMVFPWYRRDVINRNPSTSIDSDKTGTFGFAIRYGV